MSVSDTIRRFVVDHSTEHYDPWVHPNESLRELEKSVTKMTPEERLQQLTHVAQNAVGYHLDRHGERRMPLETIQRLNTLEGRIIQMNARDNQIQAARRALEGYGGPPTKNTVAEAVMRSGSKVAGVENGKVNAIVNGVNHTPTQATGRAKGKAQEMSV